MCNIPCPMKVRDLKKIIADFPDDLPIFCMLRFSGYTMFTGLTNIETVDPLGVDPAYVDLGLTIYEEIEDPDIEDQLRESCS